MNVFNRALLNLALLPLRFYKSTGIQPAQLKAILTTKLTIDDRRPAAWSQMQHKKEKPVTKATLLTMAVSVFMGVGYLLCFAVGNDPVTQLTLYFTLFFVMLSLSLIADFTGVLIDVRDNFIILPKPVNDRTVVAARLLHIFIHLCKLVLPMALPGLIYMGVSYGGGAVLLLLLLVLLLTAFSIFFINALYLVILKLTTPQRFRSIIGSVQIIMAVIVFGGYQLFPRLLSRINLADFNIASLRGIGFFPLYWLAKTWEVVYQLGGSLADVGYALAGLLLPVAGIVLVVRYLAPSFNRKLSLISAGSEGGAVAGKTARHRRHLYASFWSRLVTKSRAEKGGFDITWKLTARSRDFKLKVYPSMGYLLVLVVAMGLSGKRMRLEDLAENLWLSKAAMLSMLYFSSLLLITAISQVAYAEKYKAAWLYFVAPLYQPGEVIAGATKAVVLKFYVPIVVLFAIFGLFVQGPAVLPNLIFALFNQLLIAGLRVYLHYRSFPFSLPQGNAQKGGNMLRDLAVLFITLLIGFGHYLVFNILPAVVLCALLSVTATWLVFGSLKRTTWQQIRSRYEE